MQCSLHGTNGIIYPITCSIPIYSKAYSIIDLETCSSDECPYIFKPYGGAFGDEDGWWIVGLACSMIMCRLMTKHDHKEA